MKKQVLTAVIIISIGVLCACGGKKPAKDNTSTELPSTVPTVTDAPTEAVTPTPSPTPTPVPLPEGFPSEVPLKWEKKYSQDELKQMAREEAHSDRYQYRETKTWTKEQSSSNLYRMKSGFNFNYNEEVKLYTDSAKESEATIYSLNGTPIYAEYSTNAGTLIEYGGEEQFSLYYCGDGWCQYDEDSKIGFRYDLKDELGREISATYKPDGSLIDVTVNTYDFHGNHIEYVVYRMNYAGVVEIKDQKRNEFIYSEDGNCIFESQQYSYSKTTHICYYEYHKDARGRVNSVKQYSEEGGPLSGETLIFYHDDGSVLWVNLYYSSSEDGEISETVSGALEFLNEEQKAAAAAGIYVSEGSRMIKDGAMSRKSEGREESCFAWDKGLYHDYTYKNGLLVHAIDSVKSGSETFYEYDSQKRLTRKHGSIVVGDFDMRYTYDRQGNLVTETRTGVEISRYRSDPDSHDDEGNYKETLTFSYDEEGHRIGQTRKVAYKGTVIEIETFSYDEDGIFPIRREWIVKENGKELFRVNGERISKEE